MQRLSRLLLLTVTAVSSAASAAVIAAAPAAAQAPTPAEPAAPAPAGAPATPDPRSPPSLIAPPAPGGLTAEQVAARAAATAFEAKADAEAAAAAEAVANQAKAAFVPRLSGVGRYTRLSKIDQPVLGNLVGVGPGVPAGPIAPGTPLVAFPLTFPVILDNYVSQATLQIPLTDYFYRLPKLYQAAKRNARAARLMEQATRVRVATDARVAYYDWARARMQADVAAQSLASAQARLRDVSAASASGAASKADVLQVEAQVASAEVLLTRAKSAVVVTDERLRTLMHDRSGARYEVGEDLRESNPSADMSAASRLPLDQLVDEAVSRRLEPRALLENAGAARAQAGAARAAGFPRIDAVGNGYYSKPNQRIFPAEEKWKGTWDASLQISWSPTDVFGTEAGHSQALAQSRELEAERSALIDGIQMEVAQSKQALLESEAAIQASARGLAAAEESYRVRRALFQNGRATSVELSDTETDRLRAQLEAIATRIDQRIAESRLRHALGRDVDNSANGKGK